METGSFKHNIIIKDKKTAEKLITAVEKASKKDNCYTPNDNTYPLRKGVRRWRAG